MTKIFDSDINIWNCNNVFEYANVKKKKKVSILNRQQWLKWSWPYVVPSTVHLPFQPKCIKHQHISPWSTASKSKE